MIKATDSEGRTLEFSVYGKYEDDVQIDEIYYLESDEEVSEAEIEYVMDRYSDVIAEEWYMNKVEDAEFYADMDEDR